MFDFSSMITEFAVPIEVRLNSGTNSGSYDEAGEWVANDDTTVLKVNEPLVPPAVQRNFSYQEGGEVDTYDLVWYSEQPNIAEGTIVKELRSGREYRVTSSTDFMAYAGVMIYDLKAVG